MEACPSHTQSEKFTMTEVSSEVAGYQPAGRRGACCFTYDGAVYVLQGHKSIFLYDEENKIHRFLLREGKWETIALPQAVMGSYASGSCCCVVGEREQEQYLTVFGGWVAGHRKADVHTLNLSNMNWKKCGIANPGEGPFLKDKAGIIPYGSDMVCVVGGYGYPSWHHVSENGVYQGQKGAKYHWDHHNGLCWTNEVHLFHFASERWITPEISGQGPPPCAAFTLTMADTYRAVLFGGRQVHMRVNHVYVLRLDTWHWEGVILKSSPDEPWPSNRSFHTMCSLVEPSFVSSAPTSTSPLSFAPKRFDWLPCIPPDLRPSYSVPLLRPRLLALWGMDNDGEPVSDCWILELDPVSWVKVEIPDVECCRPRLWHVAGVWHPTQNEAQIVVFGGSRKNLFSGADPDDCSCINDTVVFLCGVPSLYSICVSLLAQMSHAALSMLPSVLPMRVAEQIVERATANKQFRHFTHIRI